MQTGLGMELEKLQKIIELLKGSDVTEFVLEEQGTTLKINRGYGAATSGDVRFLTQTHVGPAAGTASIPSTASSEEAKEDTRIKKVESPIVGTFYSRPSPDAEPFVKVGDRVNKGDKLCIVEAMKLMNEIEAPVSGKIEKICLSEGQVVEFGEVLFWIRIE